MATQHSMFSMHTLKQQLFHGEKHVDAEYEAAHAKFTQFSDSLHKLKASANAFATGMYATFFNSNNTSVEFSNLLEDSAAPNDYQVLSKKLRAAHYEISGDSQQVITNRLKEGVLAPIDAQILKLLEVNGKVQKRNELHNDLEYYLNKMAGLNKERDERVAKGKSESSSQREKHDRNQTKLDAIRNEYTSFTAQLIADLHNAWNQRVAVVGPLVAAFVGVEKEYINLYSRSLQSVDGDADLSHRVPAGTVPPPITASDVGVPAVASALGPHGVTTRTPEMTSVQVSDPVAFPSTQLQPLSDPLPVSTNAVGSTAQGSEVAAAQNQNPFESGSPSNPFATPKAAPTTVSSGVSASPQPVEGVAAAAPVAQTSPIIDLSSTAAAAAPAGGPGGDPVSSQFSKMHEDESKRQRYEEEQKQAGLVMQ